MFKILGTAILFFLHLQNQAFSIDLGSVQLISLDNGF